MKILRQIFLTALVCASHPAQGAVELEKIKLPPGFKISVFASDIQGARSLALGDKGTVFVGTRSGDRITAIAPDGKKYNVGAKLFNPNGVTFRNGSLYVGEVNRITRYDRIEERLAHPPEPVVITTALPSETHHGWKFIAFGPDGKLYVPVGAPCNVCKRDDPKFSSILRLNADGSGMEVFASGVRNTVGFDWHPQTKQLWFTDNGRDWLGDNKPPDELNIAPRAGMHFGFPFCHGKGISDPEFGSERKCGEFQPAALELGPHVAALGMRFYTGKMFPSQYRNQIFIAEHGSWNRTTPIGYRITLARIENDKPTRFEVFAEGWLQGRLAWGRPVDLLQMPDGSLLISDDEADVIYKISYSK